MFIYHCLQEERISFSVQPRLYLSFVLFIRQNTLVKKCFKCILAGKGDFNVQLILDIDAHQTKVDLLETEHCPFHTMCSHY